MLRSGVASVRPVTPTDSNKRLPISLLIRVGSGNLADKIERDIELIGELSDEQCHQLLEIANKHLVHRTLTSGIRTERSRLSETQEEKIGTTLASV